MNILLKPMRLMPPFLQILLLEKFLNRLFKSELNQGSFEFLTHKLIQIEVTDFAFKWQFSVCDQKIIVLPAKLLANTIIRASAKTFTQLALKREDSDTLFFQRKLEIEGDVALGHQLKNCFDQFEF